MSRSCLPLALCISFFLSPLRKTQQSGLHLSEYSMLFQHLKILLAFLKIYFYENSIFWSGHILCFFKNRKLFFFYKCISHWNYTKHWNAINRRQTTNIDIQYFEIVASISFSSTRSFFSYSSLICCRRINSCSELSVDFASNFCILC